MQHYVHLIATMLVIAMGIISYPKCDKIKEFFATICAWFKSNILPYSPRQNK